MLAWMEIVVNGALLGALYAMFGLGLALVFGVMRVVNLAHGEFIVFGAYAGVFALTALPTGVPPLLLAPLIALVGYALGWVLQAALVNRALRGGDELVPLIMTFGLAVIARNLMAELLGVDPQAIDGGALTAAGVDLFGLRIGVYPLLILALALALFAALHWLLARTEFGRIVRATADAPDVVRLMGVAPQRVFNRVMGLAVACAMLAGFLLAQRTSFTPFSGVERLLVAFEVVIIGGLGSIWGAFAGGILLGIAQLVGQRLDSNAGPLYAHLLFFILLVLRPQGLAGARR